jgi:hypothetical protein
MGRPCPGRRLFLNVLAPGAIPARGRFRFYAERVEAGLSVSVMIDH